MAKNFILHPKTEFSLVIQENNSLLEIGIETTTTKNGLKKGDYFGDVWKYQIRTSINDNLARWTSEPERHVSLESIQSAQKNLLKKLAKKNKSRKVGMTFPHWDKMRQIVDGHCQSYQNDFYCHDTIFIGELMEQNKQINFVWIVKRIGGTSICQKNDVTYQYYKKNKEHCKFFVVTSGGILEEDV